MARRCLCGTDGSAHVLAPMLMIIATGWMVVSSGTALNSTQSCYCDRTDWLGSQQTGSETTSPAAAVALKVARLLGDLETYVCGQSDIIIDYATARRRKEPISTAVTESTVQWLLHRRLNAQQQMRWSPRGAHLMLKVRCAVMNGTLEYDHAVAQACRPFRRAA